MGVYRDQVVPRLVDLACGSADFGRWRARAVRGLAGTVVEIGFGSGLNVPHYLHEVEVVLAVEPARVARRLAERRVEASPVPVEHVGLDGQKIPLDDGSCDAALCTFTLCTVPDPTLVLGELRRVLRAGGTVHFLEHGLSPDPAVARWQHRLDPVQRRLFDGCHLTRDTPSLLEEAGFALEDTEQTYVRGPKPWTWLSVGIGRRAAGGPDRLDAGNPATPT